jgi:hypothetical protein
MIDVKEEVMLKSVPWDLTFGDCKIEHIMLKLMQG